MSEHIHENLTGEKPSGHRNMMIIMVVFLIVWAVDSFLLRITTFLWSWTYFWVFAGVGGVIIIVAAYFINASHKDLLNTQADELATSGVFSRVRHPMYLGSHLVYLGLAVITFSLASIVVWIVAFAVYNDLANYEEIRLEERFGEEYHQYQKNVRKWIPF
ncbi:MAG: methyltransferase family protein [Candidatus Thorarchaeota archaeon]